MTSPSGPANNRRTMFTIVGADGKAYGPVSKEKVLEWIAGGRANLQTRARRDGETEWKMLGEFAEFSGGTAMPPGAAAGTVPVFPPVTPMSAPAPSPAQPFFNGQLTTEVAAPLAGRGARLLAKLIDGLAGLVVALPGLVLLALGGAFEDNFSAMSIAGLGLTGFAVLCLFIFQVYQLATRGQTIGKRLMDVKIVAYDDGTNPGFVKAVLLRVIVNGLISAVPVIGGLYSLVDILFIFRDDRRCIHDLIASTHVVKAN